MKLFYKPGACSLASHIILLENGKSFTLNIVDLVKKQLETGDDYLVINPKGQVPALLLNDGTLLTESAVIMQYLSDTAVNCHQLLAPIGSIARYKTLEWINYIATELHKEFNLLFRSDTLEMCKSVIRRSLEKKLQFINEILKDNQWIYGQNFTIADAYLFTVLRWAWILKLDTGGLHHIISYMNRVRARPMVIAALQTEGLSF